MTLTTMIAAVSLPHSSWTCNVTMTGLSLGPISLNTKSSPITPAEADQFIFLISLQLSETTAVSANSAVQIQGAIATCTVS